VPGATSSELPVFIPPAPPPPPAKSALLIPPPPPPATTKKLISLGGFLALVNPNPFADPAPLVDNKGILSPPT
jgi:hypothetical protein